MDAGDGYCAAPRGAGSFAAYAVSRSTAQQLPASFKIVSGMDRGHDTATCAPASRCRRPACFKLFNQLSMVAAASIFGVFASCICRVVGRRPDRAWCGLWTPRARPRDRSPDDSRYGFTWNFQLVFGGWEEGTALQPHPRGTLRCGETIRYEYAPHLDYSVQASLDAR